MPTLQRILVVLVGLLVAMSGKFVLSQDIDLGGLAFGDYYYVASAPCTPQRELPYPVSVPQTNREDLHGFTYRRLYLTADVQLSNRFEGRARLEANDGTSGSEGPAPFVKDLYLTWTYHGDHSATVGVAPPPAFAIMEDIWGNRSLEKTVMDRRGIVNSRDFGLRLNGPVAGDGSVRYAVMYANNSASRPEVDSYKRVYGQLSATPSERVTLVAGGDYAAYSDQRDRGLRLSASAGYEGNGFRVGAEGYRSPVQLAEGVEAEELGASVFGIVQTTQNWNLVGRFDWSVQRIEGDGDRVELLLLAGVAYRPHPNVKIIPNVWHRTYTEHEEADTLLRFTLEVSI